MSACACRCTRPRSGRSILALLPAEEVRELIDATGLPRRTTHTLTTARALHTELAAVRARGFAVDDEENEPIIRCVGAAVLGPSGRPVGGVSVTTVTFLVSREEIEAYARSCVRRRRRWLRCCDPRWKGRENCSGKFFRITVIDASVDGLPCIGHHRPPVRTGNIT
ncbi:IclR family transcriptional regulator [Streptomyces sp. NPDC054840]